MNKVELDLTGFDTKTFEKEDFPLYKKAHNAIVDIMKDLATSLIGKPHDGFRLIAISTHLAKIPLHIAREVCDIEVVEETFAKRKEEDLN